MNQVCPDGSIYLSPEGTYLGDCPCALCAHCFKITYGDVTGANLDKDVRVYAYSPFPIGLLVDDYHQQLYGGYGPLTNRKNAFKRVITWTLDSYTKTDTYTQTKNNYYLIGDSGTVSVAPNNGTETQDGTTAYNDYLQTKLNDGYNTCVLGHGSSLSSAVSNVVQTDSSVSLDIDYFCTDDPSTILFTEHGDMEFSDFYAFEDAASDAVSILDSATPPTQKISVSCSDYGQICIVGDTKIFGTICGNNVSILNKSYIYRLDDQQAYDLSKMYWISGIQSGGSGHSVGETFTLSGSFGSVVVTATQVINGSVSQISITGKNAFYRPESPITSGDVTFKTSLFTLPSQPQFVKTATLTGSGTGGYQAGDVIQIYGLAGAMVDSVDGTGNITAWHLVGNLINLQTITHGNAAGFSYQLGVIVSSSGINVGNYTVMAAKYNVLHYNYSCGTVCGNPCGVTKPNPLPHYYQLSTTVGDSTNVFPVSDEGEYDYSTEVEFNPPSALGIQIV